MQINIHEDKSRRLEETMQTSIARDKGIMKTERINYDLLFMSAAYINHKFVASE